MLHPALYKLMWLQGKAMVRRMLRGGKSPLRILVFAIGAGMVILWLGSALAMARQSVNPDRVRAIMPLALLGICILTAVTSAGDKAIAFTPGEIDQLFPGPFTRRELVGFKLIKSTIGAILTALLMSVVMLRYARWWPASLVAAFLSLIFIQFFSIVLLLMGQAIGTAAYTRLRKFIAIGAVVLALIAGRNWIAMGVGSGEAAVMQFRASPAGRLLLMPFEPFGMMMTSVRGVELARWALPAAALNAGLLVIVFLLDSYYVETAMAASERRYAKIRRLRGGSFLSLGVTKTSRWRLPQFPWAGGAGPIAWRQMTNAARSSRGLLLLLLIVAVGASPVLATAGKGEKTVQLLMGILSWLTFLCSSMLNFDFRGDIDHMESLKTLPLRGSAIAAAQLVVPVLLLTTFHALLLGIAAIFAPTHRGFLLASICVALPFNAILFGAENLIFLLFPSRPAAVSPGDFQVLGRKFVFLLGKMVILIAAAVAPIVVGILVWMVSNQNHPATTLAVFLALAAEVAILVPAIAWAFGRYDPSIHTPA